MKVVQEGIMYRPITITLETEEEAELMFGLVNNGSGLTLKTYCEQRGIDQEKMYKLTHKIYEFLDGLNICDIH